MRLKSNLRSHTNQGAEVRNRGGRLTGLISSKALAISMPTLARTLNAADPHLQEDDTDEDKDLLPCRQRRGGASRRWRCVQRGWIRPEEGESSQRGSGSGQPVAQGKEHITLEPDPSVPVPAAAPGLLVPRRLPRDCLERHGGAAVFALLAREGGFGQRRADLARCVGLVAATLVGERGEEWLGFGGSGG
jgi:hypothetical protein